MISQADSPGSRRPWRPWDALWVALYWFAGGTIAVIAIGPETVEDFSVFELFGVVAPAQAIGLFIGVAVLARRRAPWREALGARIVPRDLLGLLEGAGLQVALGLIVLILIEVFDWTLPAQEAVDQAGRAVSAGEGIAVFVALVVLAPVSEELLFRGVLLRSLLARHGPWPAVAWSAAAFALLHLLEGTQVLRILPVLFVLGVVLGLAVVRTGRLGRAVLIHAGFNLLTTVTLLAQLD